MNFIPKDDRPLLACWDMMYLTCGGDQVEDAATITGGGKKTAECGLMHQLRMGAGEQAQGPHGLTSPLHRSALEVRGLIIKSENLLQ